MGLRSRPPAEERDEKGIRRREQNGDATSISTGGFRPA